MIYPYAKFGAVGLIKDDNKAVLPMLLNAFCVLTACAVVAPACDAANPVVRLP
jgi:hypothetical protein